MLLAAFEAKGRKPQCLSDMFKAENLVRQLASPEVDLSLVPDQTTQRAQIEDSQSNI